jgi:hypothetical protein
MSRIKPFSIACALGALFLVASIAARYTIAQQSPETKPDAATAVSIEQALYLIRSTLLTLNDANRSGNYTVLRDLASPDFQARNTAADLAQIFVDFRRNNIDLYGVALLAPELTAAPALDAEKRLRLTGFFATRPRQITFDLLFQAAGGQWRLFGISITTPEAPPVQASPAKPAAPAPKNP